MSRVATHAASTSKAARVRVAGVVRVASSIVATMLVVGAVMVALGGVINRDNPIAEIVLGVAEWADGPFSRDGGVFTFDGEAGSALANWGLAAVVWIVVGRLVSRLLSR